MTNQTANIEQKRYHWEVIFWRDSKKMGIIKVSNSTQWYDLKDAWEKGGTMADIIKLAVEHGIQI